MTTYKAFYEIFYGMYMCDSEGEKKKQFYSLIQSFIWIFHAFCTSEQQSQFVDLWNQMQATLKRDWIRSDWLVQKLLIRRQTERHTPCDSWEKLKLKGTLPLNESEDFFNLILFRQEPQVLSFTPIYSHTFHRPSITDGDVCLLIFHMFACWQRAWVS